ncbi:MAG: acetyl-CoA carboxylase biotin carboxyl carrier protein [Christensenellales bacterium]|jgi:acetyl-CoA carboxylase biotin carboxyl carrier protein
MNIKMIKSLANIVNEADLSSIEVEQEGVRIKITRERAQAAPVSFAAPQALPENKAPGELVRETVKREDDSGPGLDFNNIHTIDSPMVGVFYQAAGPGEKPFVQVGSKVKKGDVLCIVEAMKLMNEINAVQDGEIVDICVSDGDVVEYGQTLFKIF